MTDFFRRYPRLRTFLLFAVIVLTAFAMRTHNYNREAEAISDAMQTQGLVPQNFLQKFLPVMHHNFMPYSIECAMMYGYIQDIAAGKAIPESDKRLHGLEDIAPYRQMIMGLEWFIGWGYRIKSFFFKDPPPAPEELVYQDNVYLAQWTSFQLRCWISLSSGFIFLLLLTLKCRISLSFFGGIFHAVAIAAIARSTGQDIIRGSFALPVISAMLYLLFSCYVKGGRWRFMLLGLITFLAFSTWDLSLGFFSALVIYELGRYLIGGRMTHKRRKAWIMVALAIVLSSLLIPFNQTYQTIMSPLVIVLLPLLFCTQYIPRKCFWKRCLLLLIVGSALFLIWNFAVKTPYYVSHYSHFSDLTAAKLKFNNMKPKDPDKLSYDARMMWTPAMHSANWKILTTYFPSAGVIIGPHFIFKIMNNLILLIPFGLGIFYLLLGAMPFSRTCAGYLKRDLPRSLFFFIFTFVFTIGFIYIVRYHEFLILFFAAALPLLLDDLLRSIRYAQKQSSGKWKLRFLKAARICIWIFCAALILLEMLVSLLGKRDYTGQIHFKSTAALIGWFRQEHIPGKCVITDFSLGPMLKCYAGAAIALQPQFGLERIRRPVQQYLMLMYHGSEIELAQFCANLKADFLVYNKAATGPLHIYSERYIAGAKHLKGTVPANLMQYRQDKLAWFYRIDPPMQFQNANVMYTVFRVIKPIDRINAMKLCLGAEKLYRSGYHIRARKMISAAFILDPASMQIRVKYYRMVGKTAVLGLNGIRQ